METGDEEGEAAMEVDYFNLLPEFCIATIISFTTPRDACRLCLVSPIFRSAAKSDVAWEHFFPPDYNSMISSSPASRSCASKKDLYFSLCDQPLLIEKGKKSFTMEKGSGKKCYMLSARDLSIIWVDNPSYWRRIPYPGARFEDVAELRNVSWLEIRGRINTCMLSQSTLYAAYIVFKKTMNTRGFEGLPVQAAFGVIGGETNNHPVFLDGEEDKDNYPKERADGWLEVELGKFLCNTGQEGELEMSTKETKRGDWKRRLIVQGIEIRPKNTNN